MLQGVSAAEKRNRTRIPVDEAPHCPFFDTFTCPAQTKWTTSPRKQTDNPTSN